MSDAETYFKVKKEIILPVMERLRAEYREKGYGCDIDMAERLGKLRSQTLQSSGAVSRIVEEISIIRNKTIVTVFLTHNGIIGVTEPLTIERGTTRFTLSDINEENLEKAIRDRFDPKGSK